MKPRKVTLLLELFTDMPKGNFVNKKNMQAAFLALSGREKPIIDVEQITFTVIQPTQDSMKALGE